MGLWQENAWYSFGCFSVYPNQCRPTKLGLFCVGPAAGWTQNSVTAWHRVEFLCRVGALTVEVTPCRFPSFDCGSLTLEMCAFHPTLKQWKHDQAKTVQIWEDLTLVNGPAPWWVAKHWERVVPPCTIRTGADSASNSKMAIYGSVVAWLPGFVCCRQANDETYAQDVLGRTSKPFETPSLGVIR